MIELTIGSARTSEFLSRIGAIDGVTQLSLRAGGSVMPSGDVISVEATNDGARRVLHAVHQIGLLHNDSLRTSEPKAVVQPSHETELEREGNEAIWEEMEDELRQESNPSVNYLALMGSGGAIAAVGLWTDVIHLIIAAQILAPGFQPLLRVPLALIAGTREMLMLGLRSSVFGYLAVAAGAALTTLVLNAVAPAAPLSTQQWTRYWTAIEASDLVLIVVAAAGGALAVTAGRTVLTAGAMVALALIPGAALVGMGVAVADASIVAGAAASWSMDVAAVLLVGGAVVLAKQLLFHRQRALG